MICCQVLLFLVVVAGPALSSPIISPAALLRTLRSLATNIGRRNAQYQYNSGGLGGFSDGTDFGNTFVNFGVSSIASSDSVSYDGPSCSTVYEEQCSTVDEQQCSTVNENQCR